MEGLHLTADCFECRCDPALLFDEKRLTETLKTHTISAGLSIVGEKFHAFTFPDGSPAGVTGTLLLAESHVAIHTWPERRAVTLDVYVCNFENDNSQKARDIVEAMVKVFMPQELSKQELQRGQGKTSTIISTIASTKAVEHLSPYTTMETQVDQVIASVQSPFQSIEIASTPEFGKIMRIDGAMMTSEKDEFYYHECLVHPAAISHGNPQTALIIGGGDGGSTEELLKYDSIQNITLCEIDEQVIALSREHLSAIHKNAFDSPKVEIIHTDGFAFIQNPTQQYDLILLDLTDPIAPNGSNLAASCMSEDFFRACYARLNEGGSVVLHLGSEFYHQARYQSTLARLRQVFDVVRPYSIFIPLYGALWGMAMAQKIEHNVGDAPIELSANDIQQGLIQAQIKDLKYYSGAMHIRMFSETSNT